MIDGINVLISKISISLKCVVGHVIIHEYQGGQWFMRIAICDDDKVFVDTAKNEIEKWLSLSDISSQILIFDNGIDLITESKRKPIDIIFLDIVMPLLNGIGTAKKIREFDDKAKIIFLTSTKEFAIASYKVEASDYLLKPVDFDELSKALYKVTQELQKEQSSIVIQTTDGFKKVYLNEIEYVEAAYKGTTISLVSGVILKSVAPLYNFEQQLSTEAGFFKCHRSYIVNLLNIDTFIKREVITKTGYRVPVARTAQKDFKEAYISFYFLSTKGENSLNN
jgi:DNA-binding LytR/AlgR family response regulator